jgi:hypothetical protein
VQLQERLLGLDQRRLTKHGAGKRRAHHEQMHRRHTGEHHVGLAPVDLALHPGRVHLRHEHLGDRQPHRAFTSPDVLPDGRLRDIRTVLVNEPLPDPLGGMPLLTRRVPIRQKPPIDHRPIPAELRRRTTHRRPLHRRQRRHQRLPDHPSMNPVPDRQPADREPLTIPVPSDLLELFHSGSHSSVPFAQRSR